jgi:hypothetical protein
MISIDEVIAHAREVADTCEYEASKYDMCDSYEREVAYKEGKCGKEHEQLAEWLEELKALREEKSEFQIMAKDIAEYNYEIGMEKGYNKALDDFVTIIKERVGMDWEWDFYFIGQIAEQLKAKKTMSEGVTEK